jgi:hypothetical protein
MENKGDMSDRYLIWSNEHGAWWRPNSCGYTMEISEAGRYSQTEAIARCVTRDQRPGRPLPELPIREDDLISLLASA